MLRKLFHRLRAQSRRGKVEHEMDAEMRFHLEMETAENILLLGPNPKTIVGVASDTRHFGLDQEVEPEIYTSYSAFSRRWPSSSRRSEFTASFPTPSARERMRSAFGWLLALNPAMCC